MDTTFNLGGNGSNTGTPSTQTTGGSTSSSTASSTGPGSAYYWLQLALQGASSYANYSSAQQANRQNVDLTQQARDWEERMANTAVQRRANDIEAAGGNRALAFTNGSEASTPNVTAAQVNPPRIEAPNIMSAKLLQAQLENVQADSYQKTMHGRVDKIDADNAERYNTGEAGNAGLQWQKNWYETAGEGLKVKILKNTETSTAAEAKRLENSVDAMITEAKNQAESGTIELDSLRKIANTFGLDTSTIGRIMNFFTPFIIKAMGK